MTQIKQEVKTFKIEYVCDNCSRGKLIPSGFTLLTNPALYPHICNQCGNSQNLNDIYPIISYEVEE